MFVEHIGRWAHDVRDYRIWLVDNVASSKEYRQRLGDPISMEDAQQGERLWYSGRQLCHEPGDLDFR